MVLDEFCNEFMAELSFRLRTAEASPAGDGATGPGRPRKEMATPLKPRESVPIKQ
jgi:hypothetical protein